LIIRGYKVWIGKERNINEIDFIASRKDEKKYFQVTEILTDENYEREVGQLTKIRDSFPKILLSLDNNEYVTKDGIECKNIISWLQNE
jgi:predicted AAA+ superfamily ATPase